ncbi:MAG: hypothetical protein AB7E37_02805 [Candidatus Altimarinota bacterium]
MSKKGNKNQLLSLLLLLFSIVGVGNITFNTTSAQNTLEVRFENKSDLPSANVRSNVNRRSSEDASENEDLDTEDNEEKIALKKEIQKRKKLHKTLLESYNTSFDESVLKNITQNGIILDSLKQKYLTFYQNKDIVI